jgi:hypothetical protein
MFELNKNKNSCYKCGTFYDCGSREPYVKMEPVIIGW